MKQITHTQAVKDIVKMFGAEKLGSEKVLTLDWPPFYIQYGTLYRFYFPKARVPKKEVIRKLQEYFEEHKFKDGYACKFNGLYQHAFSVVDIDLQKNL